MEREKRDRFSNLHAVNFRPALFIATGLCFGALLAFRAAFGALSYVDFAFPLLILVLFLRPFTRKRLLAVLLCFIVAAGVGVGLALWSVQRYESGPPSGHYAVTGTIVSAEDRGGYSVVILSRLSFDGESASGKLRATVSGNARLGDKVSLSANVEKYERPAGSYAEYLFNQNIRYSAGSVSMETTGVTSDLFLRLRARIYDALHDNMEKDEADVGYALLLGDTGGMDEGIIGAMRQGGVAHIFAVSGLHIGILFAAVQLIFRRLNRFSFLPAFVVALGYCALCGFSVSAVRALIMCTLFAVRQVQAEKPDYLTSLSLAAIVVLLISPSELLSVGFRLSFGAALGIALFSKSFAYCLKKIKLPRFLADFLSVTFSVQLFTFPVLLESFGFVSVWGLLLNLVLIPVLPAVFLLVLISALFVAAIPQIGAVLFLSESTLSLLIHLFTVIDFSLVITGFSLATGSAVWLTGCVLLSDRVRMRTWMRGATAGILIVLFTVIVVLRNVIFSGCYILTYEHFGGHAVLIRTRTENVLVIDGEISLSACKDFLSHNFAGTLDAVVVLAQDEMDAINVAAFLNAKEVRACREVQTGLRETTVLFGESFSYGEIQFFYETVEKVAVITEHIVVEIDFTGDPALGAGLFIGADTTASFYTLHSGVLRTRR